MKKTSKINVIGSDMEESLRDFITVIEKLRKDVNELQAWKKKNGSIE